MGLISKIVFGIIGLSLLAAFLYDPIYFLTALEPAWEGITLVGRGILYFFVHLPEWLKALIEFWKFG